MMNTNHDSQTTDTMSVKAMREDIANGIIPIKDVMLRNVALGILDTRRSDAVSLGAAQLTGYIAARHTPESITLLDAISEVLPSSRLTENGDDLQRFPTMLMQDLQDLADEVPTLATVLTEIAGSLQTAISADDSTALLTAVQSAFYAIHGSWSVLYDNADANRILRSATVLLTGAIATDETRMNLAGAIVTYADAEEARQLRNGKIA